MLSQDGPAVDAVLQRAVREIEAHAAEAGWDQPARLYALVPTSDLLAREPALAAAMGLDEANAAGSLTPPSAGAEIPQDPSAAGEFAAAHPDRQEVRIVAGATREGATYCALRLKSHDDDKSVVESTDLVPALLELLLGTLEH